MHIISVYSGKLTGYRATAAKVMRLLKKSLPARPPGADTSEIVLTP